jgi:hypothetical protein
MLLFMRIGKLSAMATPVDATVRGSTKALQDAIRRGFTVIHRGKDRRNLGTLAADWVDAAKQ